MKLGIFKDVFGIGCLVLQVYLAIFSYVMLRNSMPPEEIWTVLVVIGPVAAICVSTYVRYRFTIGMFVDTSNTEDERKVRPGTVALAVAMIILVGGMLTAIISIYVTGGIVTATGVKTAMVFVESLTGGGLPAISEYLYGKNSIAPKLTTNSNTPEEEEANATK